MAEPTIEVKIVRCPKCQNLLQEPKDCSFFKCGGCGTILCAKSKDREADSVSVRAKETEVNSASSEEKESDSDTPLTRHQQIGKTNTWNVQSDPSSKPVVVDSGKRTVKRCESEGFRFSASNNYFPESMSSNEAMERDRAGLVRKLDMLKEQLLKPKELQIPKAPLRFPSSGKHKYYQEHNPPNVPPHGNALWSRTVQPSQPHYSRQYIGTKSHDMFDTHQRDEMFHQSSCSCYHCYDPYHRASGSAFPPSGLSDVLHNTGFGFGSSLHSPRTFIPPRVRPLKAVSSSRLIHPIAGGAPFITCSKCFKLLTLPNKIKSATTLQCGNCSCLMDFAFVDKKLSLSTDPPSARKAETLHPYNFHSMDTDVETDPSLNIEKPQEMQIEELTSPNISEDELSSDFDYSSINVRARSRSSRSEHTLSKTAVRQNSMREALVAVDIDLNDYSQDSANETKKGGFASIVKNSFKDLKKSIHNDGQSYTTVNGHPVPERLVKMAEKQAGPIRPGNYWYDYRAGFWGVMGGQCLGILPPFIEELNYPIPETCSGGTTNVFVNGRELHQKDLRLLTARGLPRDRDRSYTVYISGRVIDIDTGEELDSLGKLAPTVDKLKRGFGMRVPRRAA